MVRLKVNKVLEEQKKTVYWLAKELKCNYNNINKLVKGETDSIKFSMLDNICNVLEVDLIDIIEYIKEKE